MFTRTRFILGFMIFLLTAMAMTAPASAQTAPFTVMLENRYPQSWVPTNGPVVLKFFNGTTDGSPGTTPMSMDVSATSSAIELYKLNRDAAGNWEIPSVESIDTNRIIPKNQYRINWLESDTAPNSVASIVMQVDSMEYNLDASRGSETNYEVRYAVLISDQAKTSTLLTPDTGWGWAGTFKTSFTGDRPHVVVGMANGAIYPTPVEREEGVSASTLIDMVFSTPMDTHSVESNFKCVAINPDTRVATPLEGTFFWVDDPAFLPNSRMTFQPSLSFPENVVIEWEVGGNACRQGTYDKNLYEHFDLIFATGGFQFPDYLVSVYPVHLRMNDNGQEMWGFKFEIECSLDIIGDLDIANCNVTESSSLGLFTSPLPLLREQDNSIYPQTAGYLYAKKVDFTSMPAISSITPAVFSFNLKKISDGTFVSPAPTGRAVGFNNEFPANASVEMISILSFQWDQAGNCAEQEIIVRDQQDNNLWNMNVAPYIYDPDNIPHHYVHYMGQPLTTGDYTWMLVSKNAQGWPAVLVNNLQLRPSLNNVGPLPYSAGETFGVNASVDFCFNAEMNRESVQNNFTLHALDGSNQPDGAPIQGNWIWSNWDPCNAHDQWVQFYPAVMLAPGKSYRANLAVAQDNNGYDAAWIDYDVNGAITTPFPRTWDFTISNAAPLANSAYPTWVLPAQGTFIVNDIAAFEVHFSGPVDFDFDGSDICVQFYNETGAAQQLSGTWSIPAGDHNVARFVPEVGTTLIPDTQYTLSVTGGYNYDMTTGRLATSPIAGTPYEFIYYTCDGSTPPPDHPYITSISPKQFTPGQTVNVTITGEKLEFVHALRFTYPGSPSAQGTDDFTISAQVPTTFGINLTSINATVTVSAETPQGCRDAAIVGIYNNAPFEAFLYGSVEIGDGGSTPGETPYEYSVHTITYQIPPATPETDPKTDLLPKDYLKSYALAFIVGGDWNNLDSIQSVNVKGENLPTEGVMLAKHYIDGELRWSNVFFFDIAPAVGEVYEFTVMPMMNPINPTPTSVVGNAEVSGLYTNASTFNKPDAGIKIDDAYGLKFEFSNSIAPQPSNFFGFNEGNYVKFTQADSTVKEVVTPWTYSFFKTTLTPGETYKIEVGNVEVNYDGQPILGSNGLPIPPVINYTINNFVMPSNMNVDNAGAIGVMYLPLLPAIGNPAKYTMIPDVKAGPGQGGIKVGAIIDVIDGAVDLSKSTEARFLTDKFREFISTAGLNPPVIDSISGITVNPYEDAMNALVTNGLIDPQDSVTAMADEISFFRLYLESFPQGQPPTIVWDFEAEECKLPRNLDGNYVVPYYGRQLAPGKYRIWVITFDGNKNGAANSTWFEISGGADFAHVPANGASDVPGADPIVLTFDYLVDHYSVEYGFSVFAQTMTIPAKGTVSWSMNGENTEIFTWTPDVPLAPGMVHEVRLGSPDMPAKTADYKPIMPKVFSFTVKSVSGPYVMNTIPRNGQRDVPTMTDVIVYFNVEMDPATTQAAFRMTYRDHVEVAGVMEEVVRPVEGRATVTRTELKFIPTGELMPGKWYDIVISTSAISLGDATGGTPGEALGHEFRFNFMTYDPNIIQVFPPMMVFHGPGYGETGVPLDAKIIIEFDQPVDPAAILGAVTKPGKVNITPALTGSWATEDNMRFAFTPSINMFSDTYYNIYIGAGIPSQALDANGNPILSYDSFGFNFTTAGAGIVGDVPRVVFTYPMNNDTEIFEWSPIIINFNKAMDHAVTENAITVTPDVIGNVRWMQVEELPPGVGDALAFKPTTALALNTRYNVKIPTAAKDATGKFLPADYIFSFTTMAGMTNTAPYVMGTLPSDGLTGVMTNTHITVNFSKQMDKLKTIPVLGVMNMSTFKNILGVWTSFGNGFDFTPALPFPENTNIRLAVGSGATDTDGQTLGATCYMSFTTGGLGVASPPFVMATNPGKNAAGVDAIDVPTVALINIVFDRPMDKTATQSAVTFSPAITVGSWTWTGTAVTIKPATVLTTGTKYTVKVAKTAKGAEGAPMVADHIFSFTTTTNIATKPIVLATYPENRRIGWPVNGRISVSFSREMNFALTESAISSSPAFAKNFLWSDPSNLSIAPTIDLSPGTLYTINISTAATDIKNQTLAAVHSFSFTTATTAGVSPQVISVAPANGTSGVPLDAKIKIGFSKNMNINSVQDAIKITPPVPGYWNWPDGKTAIFTPSGPTSASGGFTSGTFYEVMIGTGASDLGYIGLPNPHFFTFETKYENIAMPPMIMSAIPGQGGRGIPANTNITLTFDRPMNKLSVQGAFSLSHYNYDPVTAESVFNRVIGAFTWLNNDTSMVFNPTIDLAKDTMYTVELAGTARDNMNVATGYKYVSEFSTIGDSTIDAPRVVNAMPPAGAANLPTNVHIFIEFDRAMNIDAVQSAFTFPPYPVIPGMTYRWMPGDSSVDISFNQALAENTEYNLAIDPTKAKDIAGKSLISPFVMKFKTGSATGAAMGGLEVTHKVPGPDSINVPLTPVVEIGFTIPMNRQLTEAAVNLKKVADSSTISVTKFWRDDFLLLIKPTATLSADTAYRVTIGTGATSIDTMTLAAVSWDFTTISGGTGLVIMNTVPYDRATGVSASSNIEIAFNKKMNRTSATLRISPYVEGSYKWLETTAGTLAIDTLTFDPVKDLTRGLPYSVTVPATFAAADGSSLGTDRVLNFVVNSGISTGPRVINTVPFGGSLGVPTGAMISIAFSEVMEQATVKTGFVFKKASDGSSIDTSAFTFGWDATGKLLNVTPNPPLAGNTKYTVDIGAAAVTATGSILLPHTFSFTTFVDMATTAPTVVAAFPKNGQINVPIWAPIHIAFSKPMFRPEYPFTAVTFSPVINAADLNFMLEESGRRFAFYPVKALAAGTTYTVTVGNTVIDNTTAKNALAVPYIFSFTTEQGAQAPTVVSTMPGNSAASVPPFSNVVINFSQFMRFETMNAVTISPALVEGTFWFEWWGSNSLSLVHQGLPDSTFYTVTIDKTKAMSDKGVNMAADFVFSFTTGTAATYVNKPYVTFTMPSQTQTEVNPNMPVNISFSNPMNTASVESAFIMKDAAGNTVEGVFTWFGDASFIFENNLEPATVYTVKISSNAKAAAGSVDDNSLIPFEFTFTTAGAVAEKAPVVGITLPNDGAPEVPLMVNVVVKFSQKMNTKSVEGEMTIVPETEGSFDWYENTLVFRPAKPFQSNTTYSVTIGTGATSDAGVAMAADYSFSFTTGAYEGTPKILAVLPSPGFSNVPRATRLSVTFSMPMDITSTQSAFSLKDSSGNAVTGSFGWLTPDTMTFKPDITLDAGKVYSAAISTDAKGINGEAVEVEKKWAFTTGYSETIAPSVVYTRPFDKQGELPLKAEISITFSQAMDQVETPKAILILPPAQGTLKWLSDSEVKFVPTEDFTKGSKYWVTIGTGAKSVTGIALPAAYTFSFETFSGTAARGGDPIVESTMPASGMEVAANQQVEVVFDREMNELLTLAVILPDVEVQTYWELDETSGKSKMVIIPAEGWYAGSEVAIRIKGISADGSIMTGSYTLKFRITEIDTAEPFVMDVTPRDGADLVPIDVPIVIHFSEPMDTTATSTSLSLSFYDSTNSYNVTDVPCTVEWSSGGFAATMIPKSPLGFVTTFTLFVDSLKAKDVNEVALYEDLYINFTTAPDVAGIVPGTLRWQAQLSGVLSEPARGLFGGTYVTNDSGVLYAVNPDGSVRWQKAPIVNDVAVSNPTTVSSPCINPLGEIVYTIDGVLFLFDTKGEQKAAFEAKTLFFNTAVTIVGPPAIDEDGAYVVAINKDDGTSSKLYVINPDGKVRWFRNMGAGKINSPVVITREGNYLFHHSISTTHAILEYSRTGQVVVIPAVRTPGVVTSMALGEGNMVYASINDKLMAFDRRKVVPQGATEAVKIAPAWEVVIETGANASAPVVGLKGLIYAGAGNTFAAISPDGLTVVNYIDELETVAGPVKAQGLVDADGKVFFADGNRLRAVKLTGGSFETVWTYDAGVEIIGINKGRGGNLYLSSRAGALISVFGAPGVSLGASTWPKFMGNIHSTGKAVNPLKGFIKNAFAEVTPFQAVTGTMVDFTVYANVTYSTSNMPELNMITAATSFDPASFGNVEKFVDTIMVSLPGGTVKLADGSTTEVAYSDVTFTGVYNLLGDELKAAAAYDTVKKVLNITLEDKIYDSPEPFFRGVKIAFKAKAPTSIPTLDTGYVLDNKVKVFMGSSETGDFFRAEPGDGDSGGSIIRNSLTVNLSTPSNLAETAITEAYLEVQPKAVNSNAGSKKADGTVNPLERYAVHIRIPKTAKINNRGINTLGVNVPPGTMVSGVAITLNGTPLVKDVGFKGFYKPGEPIYFFNLLKAVRQTDTISSGAAIKVEFSVMTPDTYWMAPINGFLGYVSDFPAFTAGTSGTGAAGSYTALEPYACIPGDADGTSKNGDNNLLVIRARNEAPAMQNLTPATDVPNTGYFPIEWEGKDADSLVEYRLFFSEKNSLDLAAGFSVSAYPINRYPVFDNYMLKAFDSTRKQSFKWNISKLNADGTNAVPDGIYYIYVVANDGVNPPVQAVSAGRVTVDRGTVTNAKPTLTITSVATTADSSADIGVTLSDADHDPITMEMYFYPVVDKIRAFPCYGIDGEPIEVNSSATSDTLTWDTTDVPDGSYYVMVWYTDQKHPGEQIWSTTRVTITHTAISDNDPADLDWLNPDPTKPVERVQDKFVIKWKGVSDDDPNATVDFHYNKTQAEDDNLALVQAGVSLTGLSELTWDTSSINSGVYYLLAKVKENKVDSASNAVATPTLRFWSKAPIFVDQAKKGGMGGVQWVNVTSTGADIKFRSEMPTLGKVYYGVNGQVTSSFEESIRARNHKISLSGLTPSTIYYFYLEANGTSGTYTLNNNGEMYSFKTTAEATGNKTSHYIGGTTSPYAYVLVYLSKKDVNVLSLPLQAEADANGLWTVDLGNATDQDLMAITPTDGDLVDLEITTSDGKVAYVDDNTISAVGSHTSSGTYALIAMPALTDNMEHKVTFAKGFNLVALTIQPETTLTARGLLKLIGKAAVGIWQYDPLGGYKSVLRIDPESNEDSNFQLPQKGDFDLNLVSGFFLKITADSADITLKGKKLEKPEALAFQKGFNMVTVAYGKEFPFDKSTGMTASEFLTILGSDAVAVYSYESGYKLVYRDDEAAGGYIKTVDDFKLENGKSYFFKMTGSTAAVPPVK